MTRAIVPMNILEPVRTVYTSAAFRRPGHRVNETAGCEGLERDGDLGYKGLSPLTNCQMRQLRGDTDRAVVEYAKARHILEYNSKRGEFLKEMGCWLTRFEESPT